MKNQLLPSEIKELFLASKLEECIKQTDHLKFDSMSLEAYQIAQIYRGLSYYEMHNLKQGSECFENLIQLSEQVKNGKRDELDIIARVFYQWQLFDDNEEQAVQNNQFLLQVINYYKSQNENVKSFNDGVYSFGLGMYNFIQNKQDKLDFECIELLKQSLQSLKEYNQTVLYLIGWVYYYKTCNKQSISWYSQLYEINPNFPGIANNIALAYELENNKTKAEEFYLKAVEVNGKNVVILQNVALFYQYSGNKEMAETYYKLAINADPQFVKNYLYYGKYLLNLNQIEQGKEILIQGHHQSPNNKQILEFLFGIEINHGEIDQCFEYLQKLSEMDINNGIWNFQYGVYLIKKQLYEQAMNYFEKSLRQQLESSLIIEANQNIAYSLLMLNKFKECLVQYLISYNLDLQCDFLVSVESLAYIFDNIEQIPLDTKLELINNQYGPIQMRLKPLIQFTEQDNIKAALETKNDSFTSLLSILAYKQQIEPFLTFKSNHSHWDLYIE